MYFPQSWCYLHNAIVDTSSITRLLTSYNLVCKNKQHMEAGGVGMYVSERYEYVVPEDLSLFEEHIFESLFLEITNVRNKIIIDEAAHLSYLVHKSGRKTPIIIIILLARCIGFQMQTVKNLLPNMIHC